MLTRKIRNYLLFALSLPLIFALAPVNSKAQAQAQTQTPTPSTTVVGTTDWDQWKFNCSLFSDFAKKFIPCASSTFRSRPFHFVVQTVVPGSGVGGGGRYSKDLNESNGSQDFIQATSFITIRKFWYAELKFNTIRSITGDWNKSGESFSFTAYARNRSMPFMPFYGLGPNTNVHNSVQFSQRDTSAGVEVRTPFPEISWLSAGGKFEGLWPQVLGVTSANVVSIQQQYDEQTAPGLATQPPFIHSQIYLNPHARLFPRFDVNYNIAYNFYNDVRTGHYSFRRFEAKADHRFYPEKKKHGGLIEQNYFDILWRYSVSDTGANNAVPFYLQETIGGSDIDNEPSLRAFRDYRFRGPNLMTIQAEYDRKLCEACTPCKPGIIRTVCSHLGSLLAYDAGKVAFRKSDLNFSDLHQSFGGGISIYLGKDVIFRMAVALGGGEGRHPYFNVGNFL